MLVKAILSLFACVVISIAILAMNANSPSPKETKQHENFTDISVKDLGKVLHASPNSKLIMIYATWCPACRHEMPKFASMSLPPNTEKIAISLDRNKTKLKNYIRNYDQGDIEWYRIPLPCENYYCAELKQEFADIGINYYGGVPYIVFQQANGKIQQRLRLCMFDNSCKTQYRPLY
mgnify:CR=1 FL=1